MSNAELLALFARALLYVIAYAVAGLLMILYMVRRSGRTRFSDEEVSMMICMVAVWPVVLVWDIARHTVRWLLDAIRK